MLLLSLYFIRGIEICPIWGGGIFLYVDWVLYENVTKWRVCVCVCVCAHQCHSVPLSVNAKHTFVVFVHWVSINILLCILLCNVLHVNSGCLIIMEFDVCNRVLN